jgi:hypothetical protein
MSATISISADDGWSVDLRLLRENRYVNPSGIPNAVLCNEQTVISRQSNVAGSETSVSASFARSFQLAPLSITRRVWTAAVTRG